MLSKLSAVFAQADGKAYDVDEVLFTLALSVIRLETALLERQNQINGLKADLLNLEARILEAGLPLAAE